MTKSEKLRELDAEFDSPLNLDGSRMKLPEYMRRREAIMAEPDPAPVPPLSIPKAGPAITRKQVEALASAVGQAIGPILKAQDQRIAELERQLAEEKAARKLRAVS